jgi:hypothetical protein
LSCYQNAGQNHKSVTSNKYFENAEKFKYFGATVTDQNFVHKKVGESFVFPYHLKVKGKDKVVPVLQLSTTP